MTKRELIEALEALDVEDDTDIFYVDYYGAARIEESIG